MTGLRRAWEDWVAFWDEREHPVSLGLVRLFLGLCWFYDCLHIWRIGLVIPLFGVGEIGGFSDALMKENTPWFYLLFPGTEMTARGLHAAMTLAALGVMCGFFTRISAFVMLVTWAAFVEVIPYADRGIDTLSRLALIVLIFSQAGQFASFDALIRTGSVWGDGKPILAYSRRLLVLQVVLMYFAAGASKVGITWWPMGHFAALYFALQDPAVAAWDFSYLRNQPFFFFTQVGTATTMIYQISYPTVLLLMYWRRNPPTGRLAGVARLAAKYRIEWVWIGIGGIFHLSLAMTMNLGIFPWAMLALYPIWITPDEFLAFGDWFRRRFGREVAPTQS